jgi:hypothetical protein
MVLEVIVANAAAIALYEKLGFRTTRELQVLSLTAADAAPAEDADPAETRRRIVAGRTEPEPWQREDATVDNLSGVAAAATDGAVALYRMEGGRVNLFQAADEPAALPGLLAALRARGAIFALNYPADGPVATALREVGATVVVRQLEMTLVL